MPHLAEVSNWNLDTATANCAPQPPHTGPPPHIKPISRHGHEPIPDILGLSHRDPGASTPLHQTSEISFATPHGYTLRQPPPVRHLGARSVFGTINCVTYECSSSQPTDYPKKILRSPCTKAFPRIGSTGTTIEFLILIPRSLDCHYWPETLIRCCWPNLIAPDFTWFDVCS